MALFNLFGSKKPVVKKTITVKASKKTAKASPVPNELSGVDCYGYRGKVEDYFAEVLTRNFPGYELRRNVAVEAIFAPSSGAQTVSSTPVSAGTWLCDCGTENKGGFCVECGAKKPTPKPAPVANGPWICGCGASNTGKFCPECGSPRPVSKEWICVCGNVNEGKFCPECGAKKPTAPVAAPAPTKKVAPSVSYSAPASSKYPLLTHVLYQNGTPKLAILVCPKRDYDKAKAFDAMDRLEKACKKQGIPFHRYFREFRNDEAYIRNRTNAVLR